MVEQAYVSWVFYISREACGIYQHDPFVFLFLTCAVILTARRAPTARVALAIVVTV